MPNNQGTQTERVFVCFCGPTLNTSPPEILSILAITILGICLEAELAIKPETSSLLFGMFDIENACPVESLASPPFETLMTDFSSASVH